MGLLDGLLGGGIFGGGTAKAAENLSNPKASVVTNKTPSTSNNPAKTTPTQPTSGSADKSTSGNQDKGYTVTPLYQSTSGNKNTRTYRVTDNNTGKSTQTGYANIDAAGLIDYYEDKGQDVPNSLYAIAQYEADNKNTPGSASGTYYDAFTGSGTLVDRTTGVKVQTTAPSQTVYLTESSGAGSASAAADTYTGHGMPTFGDLGNAISSLLDTHESLYESDNLGAIGGALAADILLPLDLAKTVDKAAHGESISGMDIAYSALDVLGLIPGVGWGIKAIKTAVDGTKTAGKVLKTADNAGDVIKTANKVDDAGDVLKTTKANNVGSFAKTAGTISALGTTALVGTELIGGLNSETPVTPTPENPFDGGTDTPEIINPDGQIPQPDGLPNIPEDGNSDLMAFLAGLLAGRSGSGEDSPGDRGGNTEQYTTTDAKSNLSQYLPLVAIIGGVVLLGVFASRSD